MARQPGTDADRQGLLSHARWGHALRTARISKGSVRADAAARGRHGVRQRDGDQSVTQGHARNRGAGRAASGWPLASAAPADVARWLATPPFHAAVQPSLAVSLSRSGAIRGRAPSVGAADTRAARGGRNPARHPHAACSRVPLPAGIPAGAVRRVHEDLRHQGGVPPAASDPRAPLPPRHP